MIQLIKNFTTAFAFVTMIFMHIYFVLLLMAKPALATEAEVNAPSAKSTVTESKAEVQSDDEINIKLDLKNGLTVKGLTDVVKKLEALDKKNSNSQVQIDSSGFKMSVDEDSEAAGEDGETRSGPSTARVVRGVIGQLAEIIVPSLFFICVFGFAGYMVYAKNRTRREYLETIRALAQSGQPIPPELINSMNTKMSGGKLLAPDRHKYDANAIQGIKYIFLGIGFCGFMILVSEGHAAYAIGFLFIVIGAFHIYTSQLIQKQKVNDVVPTTPENK